MERYEKLGDFQVFQEQNPLQFDEEQLHKVKEDILRPRKGVVSDEYVDFDLWTRGLPSRQECFAEYLEKILPCEKFPKLLEVGCGRRARLSQLLVVKGYDMTAMDPKVMLGAEMAEGALNMEGKLCKENNHCMEDIHCIKSDFIFGETDVTVYDAVIAQEPCDATEHIVRACVAARKPFVISLCGTAHRLLNGEMPEDVFAWYDYLQDILGENGTIVQTRIVPGYISPIMIGFFQ